MPENARSPEELWKALQDAARFDSTVSIDRSLFSKMLRRHISPIAYAEENLFGSMLLGEPYILTGFPSPLRGALESVAKEEAGPAVMQWLGQNGGQDRHRLYVGPTGVRRDLTLEEIAAKWRANRTRFGVTDLHIRHTDVEDIVDIDPLSAFNLLNEAGAMAGEQEMFSLVISSRGQVTDSHSDAPDSTNYCFTGQKLWLAWDTYEGMKHGLQDVDRIPLAGKAWFDMETWLSLKSARWLLVNEGETLFLPAHLTHKVITLKRYVGIGGFFIALPNCLRVMSHWVSRVPLWSKRDLHGERDGLLGDIAQSIRDKILSLSDAPKQERRRWGYDYLNRSAEEFMRSCPPARLRELWSDPRFRSVADAIEAPWPLQSKGTASPFPTSGHATLLS
ncbi:MAG: hypothetical protein ACR2RF_26690 [Geminicoccaceae bacterium]